MKLLPFTITLSFLGSNKHVSTLLSNTKFQADMKEREKNIVLYI